METQANAQQLQTKIKGYMEELAKETDLARKSEVMQKYLEFTAKFHRYSVNNIWLILMIRPDATHVAGYQTWKKMNRWVKKGEKGIPILAPIIHKEDSNKDDSPKILNGFRLVYVFDVAQTEGDPLPPVPVWKSPQKSEELNQRLIRFAESRGITVSFIKQKGEIQGVSMGGRIEVDPSAGTKTLIHECGHQLLMHHNLDLHIPRAIRELEAESVAWVVAKHFRLDGLHSGNYIGLHGLNSQDFVTSLERIQDVSREIINGLDLTKSEELRSG